MLSLFIGPVCDQCQTYHGKAVVLSPACSVYKGKDGSVTGVLP